MAIISRQSDSSRVALLLRLLDISTSRLVRGAMSIEDNKAAIREFSSRSGTRETRRPSTASSPLRRRGMTPTSALAARGSSSSGGTGDRRSRSPFRGRRAVARRHGCLALDTDRDADGRVPRDRSHGAENPRGRDESRSPQGWRAHLRFRWLGQPRDCGNNSEALPRE